MLHQVIFDCPALPKNVERNILQFEGYDADDYEGLTMVRERARDMEEDDLQFMDWLLGLETDRSVDGLSNNICQFLCSPPNQFKFREAKLSNKECCRGVDDRRH
jgi:hypothetical protein